MKELFFQKRIEELEKRIKKIEELMFGSDDIETEFLMCLRELARGNSKPLERFKEKYGEIPDINCKSFTRRGRRKF